MTLVPAQLALSGDPLTLALRVAGLVVGAGVLTVAAGAIYRWYARSKIPEGLAVLLGVSLVALYLNSRGALSAVIGGNTELLSVEMAMLNVVTFGVAVLAAIAGSQLGDRLGESILEAAGERSLGTDVSAIVRSAGRVTTVAVPEADDIDDLEAYDPVPAETKANSAGRHSSSPAGLPSTNSASGSPSGSGPTTGSGTSTSSSTRTATWSTSLSGCASPASGRRSRRSRPRWPSVRTRRSPPVPATSSTCSGAGRTPLNASRPRRSVRSRATW